jgi:hypothetical protein
MARTSTERFSWIPLYQELARLLAPWREKQGELIAFLERVRESGCVITPLTDKDAQGNSSLLTEIDAFTFFGTFNRGIKHEHRREILSRVVDRRPATPVGNLD